MNKPYQLTVVQILGLQKRLQKMEGYSCESTITRYFLKLFFILLFQLWYHSIYIHLVILFNLMTCFK
jgi:hypothetical protein